MPGAYAHIAAIRHLLSGNMLDGVNIPKSYKKTLMLKNEYCTLGAVSPDYPYLHLGNAGSSAWADAMHYARTGDFFRNAVAQLRTLPESERPELLAWFYGYAAHVGMDMTIHPVVELKVGTYADNKRAHRVCEMHQDVFIWQRLGLGTVGRGETIDLLRDCGDDDGLQNNLRLFWEHVLHITHPTLWKKGKPQVNTWHKQFSAIVDKVEESYDFPRIARHVAAKTGVTYPIPKELDEQYLKKLKAPGNRIQDYNEIFDYALSNVTKIWEWLAAGIENGDQQAMAHFGEWNLDTGLDASGTHVFWR